MRKFVVSMLKALERKELVHVSKVQEARSEGMKKGYVLNSMLSEYGLTMPVLARYCHLRESGLTQREIGAVFGLSVGRIKSLESHLREMNIRFDPVNVNKRNRIARDHFMENISITTREVRP